MPFSDDKDARTRPDATTRDTRRHGHRLLCNYEDTYPSVVVFERVLIEVGSVPLPPWLGPRTLQTRIQAVQCDT